jgi:stage II sporulation protein D
MRKIATRLCATLAVMILCGVLGCGGCSTDRPGVVTAPHAPPPPSRADSAHPVPDVRVRLLTAQTQVALTAAAAPLAQVGSNPRPMRLEMPAGASINLTLAGGEWRLGTLRLGSGTLLMQQAGDGTLAINGQRYRGQYRFVPVGAEAFDVVNELDVEGYLKGVLPRELPRTWHPQTYQAQAVAARTYALYVVRAEVPAARHWDLHPDQRSQVYGGLGAETLVSREAVEATRGIVLAHGPAGQPRIFKTYFSSCCGGITQSASDAFGERYSEPLSDQNAHAMCSASPRFNWGPIVIDREELTDRFRAWGARRNRPEKDMALIARIDIQATNRFGRPVRFVVTDARGARYSLNGEEIRWAINTDAPPQTTVYSSFFKIVNDSGSDQIRFVDGHGWGHAVGMCQWCAQRRAELGMPHEDILRRAYPGAVLVRAY